VLVNIHQELLIRIWLPMNCLRYEAVYRSMCTSVICSFYAEQQLLCLACTLPFDVCVCAVSAAICCALVVCVYIVLRACRLLWPVAFASWCCGCALYIYPHWPCGPNFLGR